MNIPTFTPHKVTEQELEICKQLQEAQHLYCRERDCKDCPYFEIGDGIDGLNDLSCKILYAYQFCKEQRQ